MPDPTAIVFDPGSAKRISDVVRQAEAAPLFTGLGVGARPSGAGQQVELWAEVTSLVATAGRYPGRWYLRDADAGTWTAQGSAGDVWVLPANGETPATGTRYRAFCSGVLSGDGKMELVAIIGGIGSSSATLNVVPDNAAEIDGVTELDVADFDGGGNGWLVVTGAAPAARLAVRKADASGGGVWDDGADGVTASPQYVPGTKVFVDVGTGNKLMFMDPSGLQLLVQQAGDGWAWSLSFGVTGIGTYMGGSYSDSGGATGSWAQIVDSATGNATFALGCSGVQKLDMNGTMSVADGTYTVGAKLTGGGVNGTITVKGGIVTAVTPAT